MKKNITLQFLFLLLAFAPLSAQVAWDGGGDGTSWEDAMNWEADELPHPDSLIVFNSDATITGAPANDPIRVAIGGGAHVTLDLDLSLGNGIADEHCLVVNAKSTLTLASGRTFTLNPPDAKQGIASFAGADSSTVNVASGAMLNILRGTNGINFANPNSWVNIDGSVTCGSDVKNGIKTSGTATNNGEINMTELITDGIQVRGGTFTNNGTINISKPGEDGVEVITDATFVNQGVLNLVAKDDASSSNNPIAIGTDMEAGTFVNESDGEVNADSGIGENGRAISVNEMGSLTNLGHISMNGFADAGARYYNRGTTVNGMGGLFDLNDGRVNLNIGTFTNDGLIVSTREGSGIFSNDGTEAVNNGFFNYNMAGQFSAGTGMNTDNGINMNNLNQIVIDAGGECSVDIAEVPYDWFEDATLVATATATGGVTFGEMSITTDPVILTNGIPGVAITVQNLCPEASGASSVFSRIETVELKVFPSIVNHQNEVTIELPEAMQSDAVTFDIVNMNGQVLKSIVTQNGLRRIINVESLGAGMYFVRGRDVKVSLMGRFVMAK